MKRTRHKILSVFLSVCMIFSCMVGMSVPASADPVTENTYTITIPSTLTVANSGWNSIGDISATGTLVEGKKLTVSATSANGWALKSGDNSVSYTLTTAEGGSQTTSWEFDSLSSTTTTKPLGIIVADYSTKPAGTYQDTVTFTAKVEDAKPEYYDKLTKINDNFSDQTYKLKMLGRGRESYNSSLTAAQAWELAKYQAAIDNVTVYVIMSSQGDGYDIHYAVSTDAAATEHTSDLYVICNDSNPVRMYYIAQ